MKKVALLFFAVVFALSSLSALSESLSASEPVKSSFSDFDFAHRNNPALLSNVGYPVCDFFIDPSPDTYITYFPFIPLVIFPNQNISTRTGPGREYTEPGTFSRNNAYTVYYQTKGGSVNWGYVEFTVNGEKIRAYTGVKRFSTAGYLPYYEEEWDHVSVSTSFATRYGPGYEYAEAPFELPLYGSQVKAYFTENDWTMIEYSLSNGDLHRGWIPNWCLN